MDGWCLIVNVYIYIYVYIYYVGNNGELLGIKFMFEKKK